MRSTPCLSPASCFLGSTSSLQSCVQTLLPHQLNGCPLPQAFFAIGAVSEGSLAFWRPTRTTTPASHRLASPHPHTPCAGKKTLRACVSSFLFLSPFVLVLPFLLIILGIQSFFVLFSFSIVRDSLVLVSRLSIHRRSLLALSFFRLSLSPFCSCFLLFHHFRFFVWASHSKPLFL